MLKKARARTRERETKVAHSRYTRQPAPLRPLYTRADARVRPSFFSLSLARERAGVFFLSLSRRARAHARLFRASVSFAASERARGRGEERRSRGSRFSTHESRCLYSPKGKFVGQTVASCFCGEDSSFFDSRLVLSRL